jgi:hypothetical protein
MNDNRRTGRTTDLLRLACRGARAGHNVVFLVHNDMAVGYVLNLCHKHQLVDDAAYSHSARRFVFARGGTLTFAVAPKDADRDPVWGVRVLADHYVWEIREDVAVRQALREVHQRKALTEGWMRDVPANVAELGPITEPCNCWKCRRP